MGLELDRLLQSFIPISIRRRHETVSQVTNNETASLEYASLLWVDVAGFSSMSQSILENPDLGLEKLSLTLHEHYEPLLNQVIVNGGEPVFFAGDGVLCAWFSTLANLDTAIMSSVSTAQMIINSSNLKDIDGNPVLLHTYIACGKFQLIEITDFEGRRLVSQLGDALKDLSKTTKFKAPNNVLLSKAVNLRLSGQYTTTKLSSETYLLEVPELIEPKGEPGLLPSVKIEPNILDSFLPELVKKRLDVERLKWIDELRTVNILFLQLKGFKPEQKRALNSLKHVVKIISPVIFNNEGILGQLWIDEKAANVLAYFGPPPSAHSDNPTRCVKTALELNEKLQQAGFNNSIGIASGQAFCGLIGNNAFRQYTVLGDIVNLSARLAEHNKEGVWCDTSTKNSSDEFIPYERPVKLEIKGGHFVQVWRPLSKEIVYEDSELIATVGRELELQMLAVEMERVTSGNQGAFILEGASGLGKTKLLIDFVKSIDKDRHRIFMARAERIQQRIPYQTFKLIFESILGIHDVSDTNIVEHKIITTLGDELQDQANLLNVVLQVDIPENEQIAKLSSIQRAVATQALLLKLLERETGRDTFLIIIDDAQWMDEDSWKLTAEIYRQIQRCFIVCSLQSAEMVPFSEVLLEMGVTKYRLDGLSNTYQDLLIARVLDVDTVPPEIGEKIKKTSKGNPFFCIELTQALLDEKIILVKNRKCEVSTNTLLNSFKLPQTIKAVIRRRIDLLEPGPEMALKVASVAGYTFPTDAIRSMYPIDSEKENVPEFLEKDSRFGLIIPELSKGQIGYEFNHMSTQEVAYEALLRQQRELLHREAAKWIEQTFSSNLLSFFLKLANHWERAGDMNKAADYLLKEAERLFGLGYARQATEIGLRAVDLMDVRIEKNVENIGPIIGQKMASIQSLLGDRKPDELITHKNLEDKKLEKALWLLLGIGPFAFQSQQIELFALISLTALEITLKNGHGPPSADVYSMYSPVHRSLTGNKIQAYQWSKLARELDKLHGGKLHSRVAFVHTWFHLHWKEPLYKSSEISLKAAEIGFNNHDILFACFNLSAHVIYMQVRGVSLEELMYVAKKFLAKNDKRVMNAAFHLIHELQVAKALAGVLENPMVLSDDEYEEHHDIAYILTTELGNQIGYYMVSRIKLGVHFGEFDEAIFWAEKVTSVLPAFEGQVAEIEYVQFKTLALLLFKYEEGRDTDYASKEIQTGIDTLNRWSEICPENFLHKGLLLQGLQTGLEGNIDKGLETLKKAAGLASGQGFINDEGLAWEFATYLQKINSLPLTSLGHALESYARWGASGKINYLKEKYINSA